ncbi:MAG: hypothetical protein ACP6IP_07830, partial [Candidatus Njordarchaeia archaeon]
MSGRNTLKKKIVELIEKDEEFRMFIASKIGLLKILEKMAEHDRKFNEIMEEIRDIKKKMAEHDRKFNEIMEEIRDIKKKMAEHDRKFN